MEQKLTGLQNQQHSSIRKMHMQTACVYTEHFTVGTKYLSAISINGDI